MKIKKNCHKGALICLVVLIIFAIAEYNNISIFGKSIENKTILIWAAGLVLYYLFTSIFESDKE